MVLIIIKKINKMNMVCMLKKKLETDFGHYKSFFSSFYIILFPVDIFNNCAGMIYCTSVISISRTRVSTIICNEFEVRNDF